MNSIAWSALILLLLALVHGVWHTLRKDRPRHVPKHRRGRRDQRLGLLRQLSRPHACPEVGQVRKVPGLRGKTWTA